MYDHICTYVYTLFCCLFLVCVCACVCLRGCAFSVCARACVCMCVSECARACVCVYVWGGRPQGIRILRPQRLATLVTFRPRSPQSDATAWKVSLQIAQTSQSTSAIASASSSDLAILCFSLNGQRQSGAPRELQRGPKRAHLKRSSF